MKAFAVALALFIGSIPCGAVAENQPAVPSDITASTVQISANATPGPRTVPGRAIPVPTTVGPATAALIGAPYTTADWDSDPKSAEAWKTKVAALAATEVAKLPALREEFGVTSEPTMIDGVNAFIITPKVLRPENRDRVLIHLHGGGYVYNPGESGTREAILMAGIGGYKVISVDYRMPPDAPFPAAMDDATTVYKAVIRRTAPRDIAVFGTSTGGGMTLALMLRLKSEGLPLPGAIAPGTPWADMTETGDSYKTNEWLDNVLVSYRGDLSRAALLYAAGHDLRDPQLSPINGDFHGFPPAILTSGTRDLFLSNTVRAHRKLRRAGVEARLQVFEGLSHAQYMAAADAPETREAFSEIASFFDAHLGK